VTATRTRGAHRAAPGAEIPWSLILTGLSGALMLVVALALLVGCQAGAPARPVPSPGTSPISVGGCP
jgi:hypothetical protein